MKTNEEIRKFVTSHEKRFFVSVDSYGNTISVKKAYKVELADEPVGEEDIFKSK